MLFADSTARPRGIVESLKVKTRNSQTASPYPMSKDEVEDDAVGSKASKEEKLSVAEDVQVGFLCSHLVHLVHILIGEVLEKLEAAELVSVSRAHRAHAGLTCLLAREVRVRYG